MHLGNARTALLNAPLARRGRGAFLLRLEDTGAARRRAAATGAIRVALR